MEPKWKIGLLEGRKSNPTHYPGKENDPVLCPTVRKNWRACLFLCTVGHRTVTKGLDMHANHFLNFLDACMSFNISSNNREAHFSPTNSSLKMIVNRVNIVKA